MGLLLLKPCKSKKEAWLDSVKNRSAMRTWGLMLILLHSALIEYGIAVSFYRA